MTTKYVYLDNNATTPLHPEVKSAMIACMDQFGNASSAHEYGRNTRKMIENARDSVARYIGSTPDEIVFLGSGSEANNTVLNIFASECYTCRTKEGNGYKIITTQIEHPCILQSTSCLSKSGMKVDYLDVNPQGRIKFDQLEKMLEEKTRLVSIMMANNEIGTIQDIKKISQLVHKKGALFHTDAVQAIGKIPVNVEQLGIDFLSISAHKIHGPKGIGALYVKKGTPFCSLIHGGHQERGRRAGTENTIGIVGLGKAIELLMETGQEDQKRVLNLKNKLLDGIKAKIPDIHYNGHPTECLPGTLNISFMGAEGEAILLYLDMEGIAVSTGSACATGSLDPSHVIMATGVGAEIAHGSIRFSISNMNTKEDVDYVLKKLPPIIEKVRSMSTAYVNVKK